ncbi:hypothetical protein MPER_02425 [Moniliophthora perniciosa FA553]|nr:hypothetical protein MPER_02425 [Moniliophthora perniciosa FA553]
MIDATGHLVLVGFDCAQIEGDKDRFHGTTLMRIETQHDFDYRAPELLLGWSHDSAVDCWSFGCILYFMIAGKTGIGLCEAIILMARRNQVAGI